MADTQALAQHNHSSHTNPWPFTAALGLMLTVFSIIPLIRNLIAGWILMPIGVYLFLLGIIAWLVQMANEQRAENIGARTADPASAGIATWAVWFVIISELFLFGALFACYFYLKNLDFLYTQSKLHFFIADGAVIETFGPLVIANTILLLTSSVTLHFAETSLKKENLKGFQVLLGVTIVLGLVFLSFQVLEYLELIGHGFTAADGAHGTLFYTITAIHGIHVSVGALLLIWIFVGSFFGQSGKNHRAITVIGIYWHFVDLVWIFLVLVLYLRLI